MSLSIAVVIVKGSLFFCDWVIGGGGFTHLQAWIYVVPEHVEHSRPLMFKRLLLVHSALEHIQCFNCCSSKIVNTKVGPVIDIDKALLMTKLLHCFVIA